MATINSTPTKTQFIRDEAQINFICNSFLKAINNQYSTAYAPLIIVRTNVQMKTGFCDTIEIRGSFSKEVVEEALFRLSSAIKEWGPEAYSQNVESDLGYYEAIRFIKPTTKISFAR